MRCLITCGPTYESLDKVRRITNFSTGKLGIGLAKYLDDAGHEVTLLKGYYAICLDACRTKAIPFTTTQDLLDRFREAAKEGYDAIFHAAAVSDFGFGRIYRKLADGKLDPITSGKFGTRDGNLFAELVPTPKIIGQLRALFPSAVIVGWKYEVEGSRESAIGLGQKQIAENRTNFCVVNGTAYGFGFGILSSAKEIQHCSTAEALYAHLLELLATSQGAPS
jgi:phosphopantothenate---cysteine ligase (CTP)